MRRFLLWAGLMSASALVGVVFGLAGSAVFHAVTGHSQPAAVFTPAIFTPPPAFCPDGQHVVSTGAAGWPVCAANR